MSFTPRPNPRPYRTLVLRVAQVAACIAGAYRFGPGTWTGIACAAVAALAFRALLEAMRDVLDHRYAQRLIRETEARRAARAAVKEADRANRSA